MLTYTDNDMLAMAREQQQRINTSRSNEAISEDALKAQCDAIVRSIQHVSKLKMLPRIASRLEEISQALGTFTVETLERYVLQNKNTRMYDATLEALRGAVYQMIATLSDKEIRVSLLNNKHRRYLSDIRCELRSISRLLQDDTIDLDIEMDCSRDEEIARSLAESLF